MAPVRLRHPKGVTTLQVDLTNGTVQDLQQLIFASTEIPPSQQDLKAGYPPHPLTLVPELPIESLGLKQGEQLVVTQRSAGGHQASHPPKGSSSVLSASNSQPQAAMTGLTASQARASPIPVAKAAGPDHVPTSNGYLMHRIVPDDNSCLFTSIALIFEQDKSKAQDVRRIIADSIRKDPVQWNEAILGRPCEEYIETISKPSAWGGAIELSILAQHYNTEIASVDVETGRVDRFPPSPEADSGNRAIVLYSGIHYDATSVAPMLDAPDDFHQTIMRRSKDGEEDEMLEAAGKLATALRAKRAYTNTATFDLKCQVCGKGLKGEKEARAHASETGHVEFGEY